MGDFNVHHREWLGSSTSDRGGRVLKDVTVRLDLQQVVKESTRRNNILDLIVTNLPAADANVHDSIRKSGHCIIRVETKSRLCIENNLHRVMWHYHRV